MTKGRNADIFIYYINIYEAEFKFEEASCFMKPYFLNKNFLKYGFCACKRVPVNLHSAKSFGIFRYFLVFKFKHFPWKKILPGS